MVGEQIAGGHIVWGTNGWGQTAGDKLLGDKCRWTVLDIVDVYIGESTSVEWRAWPKYPYHFVPLLLYFLLVIFENVTTYV